MKAAWITLFNRKSNHDKVYVVWVNHENNIYYVFGSWGRRSAYLRNGVGALAQKCYSTCYSLIDAVARAEDMAYRKVQTGYTINVDGVTPCSYGSIRAEMAETKVTATTAAGIVSSCREEAIPAKAQVRRLRLLEL